MNIQTITSTTLASTEVTFALENNLWLNATEVAKQFGKKLSHYWDAKDTKEYIEALNKLPENRGVYKETVEGRNGGTYIAPELVVHFARYCSSDFAVACDQYIKEQLVKKANEEKELIEAMKNKEIESVIKLKDQELKRALYEAKKLNEYDGMLSVKKFVNEIIDKKYTQSFVWDALEHMGWMKNIKIEVTERRLDESCPAFVGGRIPKTQTPIYTEAAIREAIRQYIEYLTDETD